MSQIVIVSNRLPVSVKKEDGVLSFFPSVGGLATGLSSYVNDKRSMWIGWPGIASEELTSSDRKEIIEELAKHNCSPVFLTQKQIDDFYNGYSNTVLWPLFHQLRPQDKPGERRNKWYKTYRTVNKLFAENIAVATGSNALVWVHDYQLLLVPEMLRAMKLDAMIGFFLHIPFPDTKKFTSMPGYRKVLKGVLGADLIGFHTPGYVDNFLTTCDQSGLGEAGNQTLVLDDRTIRVSDFPMGIDYEKYASSGRAKVVKQAVSEYKRRYRGKKVIVAVDRLDPSKGLLERLSAYGQFLEQYPKQIGRVVFVMVAAPSRTDVPAYQRLAKRLDQLVEQINSTYGNSQWQPIEYINHTVPFEEVTALFQIADVAFIAPLRDGMNLAAKEFVASTKKDSVLILSETAGASEELGDALIVNPRKPETVVDALQQSLTMRRPELRRRLKRMKNHLKRHTVQSWAKDFMVNLQTPLPNTSLITRTLEKKAEHQMYDDFKNSSKRLIFLDYDGSLVPFTDNPAQASPSKSLLKLIEKLGKNPANEVVIISGRSVSNLNEWFGKLPISLVAEHGASYTMNHSRTWFAYKPQDDAWKQILLPVLEKYADKTPGAQVEVKAHSLVWHYRASPPYYAQKYSVTIRRALKPFLKSRGLVIQKGNKVLEIKDPDITKGKAAQHWLGRDYDFIYAIGDDTTDEELFEVLPESSYSIKVGRGRTAAHYRVADHRAILKTLDTFAKYK